MRKLNVTDRQKDRRTDGQTDGGRCNISRPGPSAPREIIITLRGPLIIDSSVFIKCSMIFMCPGANLY